MILRTGKTTEWNDLNTTLAHNDSDLLHLMMIAENVATYNDEEEA